MVWVGVARKGVVWEGVVECDCCQLTEHYALSVAQSLALYSISDIQCFREKL